MIATTELPDNTAARRLVQCLVENGVTHVFCVPGESFLAVLNALGEAEESIRVIVCRNEAGAANMAVAYGKLTGRPGICLVTRGPGATHASIGVHNAHEDSVPMILFVGQVAHRFKGRGAFQELDYPATFGHIAKLAVELDDPERVVEITNRAFSTALQGRRGPVVVSLPEDILTQDAGCREPQFVTAARAGVSPEILAEIGERLTAAARPLLIMGGTGWSESALAALSRWAAVLKLPIILSFRRKDLIDNEHPCYIGDIGFGSNPQLLGRIKEADLIIALGARLGEVPSQGYTLFNADATLQKLVHIHPGAEEIGRVWPAGLSAVADLNEAALALSSLPLKRHCNGWLQMARADFERFTTPIPVTGQVNLSEICTHLSQTLAADAIVCNGAGNYTAWLHRFFRHRKFGTQLAPTSGAMGFGLPAGVAAKIMYPERDVVVLAGDGCFLMTGQELATAIQYNAAIVIIVVDNGSLSTIRMHQEYQYPGKAVGTDLRNPDFVAYARSFGAWGRMVDRTEDFPDALWAACAAGVPALVHLRVALEDIAPGLTISRIRAASLAGGRAVMGTDRR